MIPCGLLIIKIIKSSPYIICLRGAATELGKPKNLNISGKMTRTKAPIKAPFVFPIPPKTTIKSTMTDSIGVKLEGSMNVM